jgi:hypothetical protein
MLGPNLLELQDQVGRLSDSDLTVVANKPGAHQIVAFAELAQRQRMRQAMSSMPQGGGTIAQRLSQGAPLSTAQEPTGTPQSAGVGAYVARQNFAAGGAVQATRNHFDEGGAVQTVPGVTNMGTVTVTGRKDPEAEPIPFTPMDMSVARNFMDFATPYADDTESKWGRSKTELREMRPQDRVSPLLSAIQAAAQNDEQALARDRWFALAQAGLAAAAGQSPDFLTNVAMGANTGLGALRGAYDSDTARRTARDKRTDELTRAQMLSENQLYGVDSDFMTRMNADASAFSRDLVGQGGRLFGQERDNESQMDRLMRQLANALQVSRENNAAGIRQTQISAGAGLQGVRDRIAADKHEANVRAYTAAKEGVTEALVAGRLTPEQAQAESERIDGIFGPVLNMRVPPRAAPQPSTMAGQDAFRSLSSRDQTALQFMVAEGRSPPPDAPPQMRAAYEWLSSRYTTPQPR